jgi:glutaconate CoA-transferase subunit A
VGTESGNKIISIDDVAALIRPGQTIGIGGMTLYRRPVSLIREVIRSGQSNLKLLAVTCGFESDLVVGNGQASEVAATYFGLEFLGLAPCFTRMATDRMISVREETETSIILGLKASATGVSFMPARFGTHTDLLTARPDVLKVTCPYTGGEFIAWPSLTVDLALIHVNACDKHGNAYVSGQTAVDALLAAAARRVVISTERIVSHDEIQESGALIVGKTVDNIVATPYGAHPTALYPEYRVDVPFLTDYVTACREDGFQGFLEDRVLLPREEYRRRFIDQQQLAY